MVHEYLNDFNNLGWKLHLPVVDSTNDPLTKEICDFLNEKFGITEPLMQSGGHVNKNGSFSIYKVGGGGHLQDGSGITIYGQNHTQEEIFNLAKEIDEKFGARILEKRKQFGIKLRDEYKISDSVTTRFVVKDQIKLTNYCRHEGFGHSTGTIAINRKSPGITTKVGNKIYKTQDTFYQCVNDKFPQWANTEALKNEYNAGCSMLECIDSFGELVTGKMKNGIPKPILDAFGPNFLKENPDLLKNLPERVQKGNENFAKIVFRYIGEGEKKNPVNNRILNLHTEIDIKLKHVLSMDEKTIQTALKRLSEENPKEFKYIVDNFDDLILKLPDLKTKVFKNMLDVASVRSIKNNGLSWVNDIYAKFKTSQVATVQKPTTIPTVNKQQELAKKIVDSFSKGKKAGLCIVGAVALTGVVTSIFEQNNNKEVLANNKPCKKTNVYNNTLSMPKGDMIV